MIINTQHHELLLSYYKEQYMKLPHGRIETHRGKPVIALIYDPNDPDVTSRHTRRFTLTSKNGQFYQKLIEESSDIKRKIDELTDKWNNTYKGLPQTIHFPLKKRSATGISTKTYLNSLPNQNPREYDNEIIYKDQRLRSKNELIVCQALDKLGYEYKTEIIINTNEYYSFAPDLTYYIKELEKPVAMEIDGAMDKEGYFDKAEDRKRYYIKNGYKEFKDVVFFRLNEGKSFDYDRLEAVIQATILVNLNDIIT